MKVYIDILIVTNIIVDWILLSFCSSFLHIEYKIYRVVISSVVGGISSLIMLLPTLSPFIYTIYSIVICLILILIAFGFYSITAFLKRCFTLYLFSFIYSASMQCLYNFIAPNGMIVKNNIVYYQLSPIVFLLFTALTFVFLTLYNRLIKTKSPDNLYYSVDVSENGKTVTLKAFFDSGNFVKETLSSLPLIIVDSGCLDGIIDNHIFSLESLNNKQLSKRVRLVTFCTAQGQSVLPAVSFNNVKIYALKKMIIIPKCYIAISKTKLSNGEFNALLPNYIFNEREN